MFGGGGTGAKEEAGSKSQNNLPSERNGGRRRRRRRIPHPTCSATFSREINISSSYKTRAREVQYSNNREITSLPPQHHGRVGCGRWGILSTCPACGGRSALHPFPFLLLFHPTNTSGFSGEMEGKEGGVHPKSRTHDTGA